MTLPRLRCSAQKSLCFSHGGESASCPYRFSCTSDVHLRLVIGMMALIFCASACVALLLSFFLSLDSLLRVGVGQKTVLSLPSKVYTNCICTRNSIAWISPQSSHKPWGRILWNGQHFFFITLIERSTHLTHSDQSALYSGIHPRS